ncbi:rhomboid family intramembrane serine protease [Pseudodesulfovibrio sp.]|nr:rhomboid family intramembrane serine protease [Pseudodesulfovibrio sp.]
MSDDAPSRNFLLRALRPQWIDLAPRIVGEDAPPLSHGTAKLWALVLASRHIPYRMRQLPRDNGGGHTVQVQRWFEDRAIEEIRLYLNENAPGKLPVILPDLRPVSGLEPTMGAMACLILFYWLYTRTYPSLGLYPKLWLDLGSAEAARILSGEWWRVFTALTLHGDGAHVVGNALIGGVFVWLASRRLGAGLAWLLTLLGGGVGNLLNSLALSAPHNAIGFSTASFAAAGILAGITPFGVGGGVHGLGSGDLGRRIYAFIRSALVPVAAGLGLLAMLGAGENTDLGAHLFGFLSGLGLGLLTGLATTRLGLPGQRADAWLYVSAMAFFVFAWCLAWLA